MKIIQKRADQLQAGDILVMTSTRRLVVLWTKMEKGLGPRVATIHLGEVGVQPVDLIQDSEDMFNVEAHDGPDVSAEEFDALLATARVVVGLIDSGEVLADALPYNEYSRAKVVLARMRPPEPPTAQELAQALSVAIQSAGFDKKAGEVLERARKAGLI